MLIPCNIHVIATTAALRNYFALYSHSDAMTGEIKYVGVTPLSELFRMTDAQRNSKWIDEFAGVTLELRVIGLTDNEAEAFTELHKLIRTHRPVCNIKGVHSRSQSRVQCVETGEIFKNASEAATAHNVTYSQLHSHLAGKPGHLSVKGRRYVRIVI